MKRLLDWLTRIDAFRLALAIGALFAIAHVLSVARGGALPLVDRLNWLLYDTKLLLRGPIGPTDAEKAKKDVVIATGDLKTIEEFGRWPWDRDLYARVIKNVLDDGAKVIAFDMTFADAERSSEALVKLRDEYESKQIGKLGGPASEFALLLGLATDVENSDVTLAAAVRDGGERVVLGYVSYPVDDPSGPSKKRAEEGAKFLEQRRLFVQGPFARIDVGPDGVKPGDLVAFEEMEPEKADRAMQGLLGRTQIEPPVQVIADATKRIGYFNAEPDEDGVIRSVPLVRYANGMTVPCLPLVAAAQAMGISPQKLYALSYNPDHTELEGIWVDPREGGREPFFIPTSPRGSFLVDFHGPDGSFQYVSLADIYNKRFPPGTFRDRVALVGVTAIGTHDQRVTPFDEFSPGVEVQAAAIQNLLDGRMLRRPGGAAMVEFFVLLLIAVGLGLVFARVDARVSLVAWLVATITYFVVDYQFFTRGIVLTSAMPQLQLLVTFIGTTSLRYLTESREKERVRNTFKFYLDTAVMDQMLTDPSKLTLGGDKKELSVLFSDIRGFTTISEKLPPEQLSALLNEYLTPMTNLVFQHGGTLDKYMGDAVMCFFGAPLDQKDHALRACRTALAMMAGLEELKAGWRARGLPEIDIGIGVNSGPMVVGNFGSAQRGAYTVMGDNVNLASRLEGTNKEYGTHIIISEFTCEPIRGEVAVRELGAVKVKGKKLPVKIYELLAIGPMPAEHAEFVRVFEEGLRLRHPARRFAEAAGKFRASLALRPDDLTATRYAEECEKLAAHPPPEEWDGVYEMKTK